MLNKILAKILANYYYNNNINNEVQGIQNKVTKIIEIHVHEIHGNTKYTEARESNVNNCQ